MPWGTTIQSFFDYVGVSQHPMPSIPFLFFRTVFRISSKSIKEAPPWILDGCFAKPSTLQTPSLLWASMLQRCSANPETSGAMVPHPSGWCMVSDQVTMATTVKFTHLEVVSAAVWKFLTTSPTNGIWNKDLPIWHPMFNPFRSVYPGRRQPALKPVQQWKQLLDIFQGPLILVEPEMVLQDT